MKKLSLLMGILLLMDHYSAQLVLNTDFGMQKDSVVCYFPDWPKENLIRFTKQSWQWYERYQPASLETFQWDKSSSSWDLQNQTLYTYHPIYREEILSLTRNWNDDIQNWGSIRKDSSYFDSEGLLVEKLWQVLQQDSALWMNHKKETYQYNSDKQLIQTIFFVWNQESINWEPFSRGRYSYDQDGRLSEILSDQKYRDSSAWIWIGKTELRYNAFDQIIEEIQTYAFSSPNLLNYYTSTYDSLDRLIEVIEYSGLPSGQTWRKRVKRTFLYDTNGQLYREKNYLWDASMSFWSDFTYCDYYGNLYTITSVEKELKNSSPFCDLPNPYQSNLPFTCEQLESHRRYTLHLLDLSGRVIQENSFGGDEQVYFDAMIPAGIYFLMIQEDNKVFFSQKIVIR